MKEPILDDSPSFESRYELRDKLGEGGVGAVYEAYDRKLAKTVAVKVLLPGFSDEAIVRFQQEARATARLNHPNVIQVLDFGETSDQRLYLVMEYIEGESLQTRITRDGPLNEHSAIEIFTQICEGLQHAHEHDVLHRDVKPSNIMLTYDENEYRQVKIVDFGIAKLESKDQGLTTTGVRVGSPHYMSPEQAGGESVDRRSDIYSLGCLMFKALSGRAPIRGETYMEIIMRHMEVVPPPVSRFVELEMPSLDRVIARSLEKDPEKRFQTARQLKDALIAASDWQEETSIYQQIQSGSGFTSKVGVAVAALILFILAGGFFYLKVNPIRTPQGTKGPVAFLGKDTQSQDIIVIPPGVSGKQLIELKRYKHVKKLLSKNPALTDADMKYLTRLKLEQIDLSNSRVSNEGLRQLSFITSLKSLVLNGCKRIDDTGVSYLNTLPELQVLSLKSTRTTDVGLHSLQHMESIACLDLSSNSSVSDKSLRVLAKLKNLKGLYLRETSVTPAGIAMIPDLMPQIRFLSLAGLGLNDKDLKPILKMSLKALLISNNMITDEGLKESASISGIYFVEAVDCPKITREGYKAALAALSESWQRYKEERGWAQRGKKSMWSSGHSSQSLERIISNYTGKETLKAFRRVGTFYYDPEMYTGSFMRYFFSRFYFGKLAGIESYDKQIFDSHDYKDRLPDHLGGSARENDAKLD